MGAPRVLVPVKTVEVVNCDGDTAQSVWYWSSSRKMEQFWPLRWRMGSLFTPDPERAGTDISPIG